jgi:hypothetical protein
MMSNNSLMKAARATASPLATYLSLPFRIMLTVSIPLKGSPRTKEAKAKGPEDPKDQLG